MFLVDIVPRFALPEAALLRRVYEQHLATPLGGFGLVQYADSNGDAGPGEEVGRQSDDRLEQVGLHDALAYLPLRPAPEQDAVGHHDPHHALRVDHAEHVQ